MNDRQAHWIRENRQERIPPRMIALDTESRSKRNGKGETQTWRMGCAIRWRTDTKQSDHAEAMVFSTPSDLWSWVSDYCRKNTRTVVWAHNLGYDVRISSAFTILPQLGFTLEWCNLDRNVSAMTWRSDHGTLVLADTYTWVPVPAAAMAARVGMVKFVYRVVRELIAFIRSEHLGNWQPTGAGMSYAAWRHRFLQHKVLVHDDAGALEAERAAMHTGRAEAWRHGEIYDDVWTEIDMRNAYLIIAAECDLPRKLRYHTGAINRRQFDALCQKSRVLCKCEVQTSVPCVPARHKGRTIWPVGTFTSWLWDTEVSCAMRYGATVRIREAYIYASDPVLSSWATWVLHILRDGDTSVSPIARTWLKHSSRALIGRLSLKSRSWELYGANPTGETGISRVTDAETGVTRRLMHVGDKTFMESDIAESSDSIPMITGWIMAECRVRLWDAMNTAGLAEIAHVDTDSMVISRAGLGALRASVGSTLTARWQVKGSWRRLAVYGPRHYYRGRQRVIAGVPLKSDETSPGVFAGEKWASTALDMQAWGDGIVTTWHDQWKVTRQDPRRRDMPGVPGRTESYGVGSSSLPNSSSSPRSGVGA